MIVRISLLMLVVSLFRYSTNLVVAEENPQLLDKSKTANDKCMEWDKSTFSFKKLCRNLNLSN